MMDKPDIVFVNGLIKSMEKNLISAEKFARITEAESAEEVIKTLRESGFGGEEEYAPQDYERMIADDRAKFLSFLRKYCPKESILQAYFAQRDFHNAECALRAKYVAVSQSAFLEEGEVSLPALLKAVETGDYSQIPAHLSAPMKKGEELFIEQTATGIAIGTLFRRAHYEYLLKVVRGKEQKRFLQHEIDAKNLSVAFRSKTVIQAESMYVAGGKISQADLNLVVEGDTAKITRRFSFGEYADLVALGLEARAEQRPMVEFERYVEDFALKKLKERRFETEGLVPLLLFVQYKENEWKNVRIAIVGKLNGVEGDAVRKRLRECYNG
ncbi:MAG: V-type ATPase subunit [Clostridia bacterium]|nr:V-type ATPase subunit [Clostridia bacterium]